MKIKNIKYMALAAVLGLGTTSCDDFLDRPSEDSYNVGTYYQTDAQCIAGVNYLYNSPWYDFQRGFFKVGEVLSGNYYMGSSPYLTFTLNSTDADLRNMSYSLWAVNGHANVVRSNIANGRASHDVKNQTIGECLLWKAMAYFYLVRTFGDVPIIHDNTDVINSGSYNDQYKVKRENVYEYIVMTLEKAIELLPETCAEGRLDKYCAKGLLAKVYLTRAGLSGSLNSEDLEMASSLSKDVLENSGRELMKTYSDIFRLTNNNCPENMIAWRWTAEGEVWTSQNSLQSDLGMQGFDENGSIWGGYGGPSVDLQEAFGIDLINQNPGERIETDVRRKATMMIAGDVYEYFWQDKGGFDYLKFLYDEEYGAGGPGTLQSSTGANSVKHLVGDKYDHESGVGHTSSSMKYSNCTPILRLADVYLVHAEAEVLKNGGTTTSESGLKAYNAIRARSINAVTAATSITFDDVWKERRKELACEGDRWYDYVRLSYYNMERAINEIKAQKRNAIWNMGTLYEEYYTSKTWTIPSDGSVAYDTGTAAPNVTASSFTLPFPQEDLVFNKHLSEDPIAVDVRSTYSY